MRRISLSMIVALALSSLALSACRKHQVDHHIEHPAEVVAIDGSDLSRVTLTERAIQRLDVKIEEVREATTMGKRSSKKKVVPYSSLIYDPQGNTWVYTSPEPRTFVRHRVEVEYIEGDVAVLNEGPAVGTMVASVGVAELYGAEFKVGH